MRDELITFETAKLAKEKGFNIPLKKGFDSKGNIILFGKKKDYYITSDIYYSNDSLPREENTTHFPKIFLYTAPTQSLLQRWLREVHSINVYPIPSAFEEDKSYHDCRIQSFKYNINTEHCWGNTYEEALEVGLQEGLKLIKS
jgi:hypothetical protein